MEKWSKLTHPWLGRNNIRKMNVLPRILYVMQTLPNLDSLGEIKGNEKNVFEVFMGK